MARKGSDTQVMSGAKGSIVVNDTSAKAFNCDMIVILEDDTIITNLEVDGVVANESAAYITTPATGLKKGAILTPLDTENHSYFSSVTISAGSLNLVSKVDA